MGRVILHSDFNAFYASVECFYRPELRCFPVAVAGDPDKRHGVILAKNELAKKMGVKTGEPIWQAKQKAPNLVTLPPNFSLYERISRQARTIYGEYTNRVEPFGLDESWLDVSGPGRSLEDGAHIAQELRKRIRRELGLTVSIGVADNKVFAKLGSDMKKPDAVTVLTPEVIQQRVWPLPSMELLYVGPATQRKLQQYGIVTIGDIARADPLLLKGILGKWGLTLHLYAAGKDPSAVALADEPAALKSVGNSITTPHDLQNEEDVRITLYLLCESVAERLRSGGFKGTTLKIQLRDTQLVCRERQCKLSRATNLASDLAKASLQLFDQQYNIKKQRPLRSLGVTVTDLLSDTDPVQLCLLEDGAAWEKQEALERTVDEIRRRFGHRMIQRAVVLQDQQLGNVNPGHEHRIAFLRADPGAAQERKRQYDDGLQ